MNLIYAREPLAQLRTTSIFLAGPTPRSEEVQSWRPDAIRLLDSMSFAGDVLIPEPRGGKWTWSVYDQIDWEWEALTSASHIVFWVPRQMSTMPGLTTNIEWGVWASSGKVTLGYPPEAEHVRYMSYMAKKIGVTVCTDLRKTLQAATNHIARSLP